MPDPDIMDETTITDPREIIVTAVPIFCAEAVVVVALFMGAMVTVRGHALWAVVLGWAE